MGIKVLLRNRLSRLLYRATKATERSFLNLNAIKMLSSVLIIGLLVTNGHCLLSSAYMQLGSDFCYIFQ